MMNRREMLAMLAYSVGSSQGISSLGGQIATTRQAFRAALRCAFTDIAREAAFVNRSFYGQPAIR